MVCSVGFADTKYSDLLKLNKSDDPKKVIELIEKLTLGFEIETSFIEDCASHLKIFKEKSNDKCAKVLNRGDSMERLINIFGSSEFKTNVLNLSKQIDNNSIDFINGNELMSKLEILMEKHDQFSDGTKTVSFLLQNL
mgnify:FL=1|jgi:hypothetical protein